LVQKNEILEMQLENSKELKELKEQLAISHSQLAKERGTLVSQGNLAKRVKDDFQR
jgi:predicted transcriptional regulator